MRAKYVSVLIGAVAIFASSCAAGPGTSPTSLASQLSTRQVSVTVSGGTSYSATADAAANGGPAGFEILYDSSSTVAALDGTLAYSGAGVEGEIRVDLTATPFGMDGTVRVVDPSAGINVSVSGISSNLAADDHGDVSFSLTSGATTITVNTSSYALPDGTNPELEALLAAEADFCAEGQIELAGLDEAEVPVSSIINEHMTPRATFAGSKSLVSPLTVRTWTEAGDITDDGEHFTISKRISCKMRAADHVATTGLTTTSPDLQCSVLNQKSIDLALAQMTPTEQANVQIPTLGSDVVRQTGAEWTTPLAANNEFNGTTLRAHALLTEWNDPAFALFPDTIRGVHYCTVWSPSYAYFNLLESVVLPI